MDLSNRLSEAQCDPRLVTNLDSTIELLNSETGDALKTISTPYLKRVSRRKLRALCTEGIEVLWEKTLIDVTYESNGEGLTAHFTDESMYYGDVLVGADGPKSKVREILLGAEKAKSTPLDIVYNMSIVKYNDAKEALHVLRHPQNSFGYNPNGTFSFLASMNPMSMSISLTDHDPVQDMPDPKRPETWTFQVGSSWKGQRDTSLSNEERMTRVKKAARELSEPFRSANLWMPDDTIINIDPIAYWVPIPFDNHQGRITLCGDAAHPLPPCRFGASKTKSNRSILTGARSWSRPQSWHS